MHLAQLITFLSLISVIVPVFSFMLDFGSLQLWSQFWIEIVDMCGSKNASMLSHIQLWHSFRTHLVSQKLVRITSFYDIIAKTNGIPKDLINLTMAIPFKKLLLKLKRNMHRRIDERKCRPSCGFHNFIRIWWFDTLYHRTPCEHKREPLHLNEVQGFSGNRIKMFGFEEIRRHQPFSLVFFVSYLPAISIEHIGYVVIFTFVHP